MPAPVRPRPLPVRPLIDGVGESERYLQDQLITYIGNKRALLPFISEALDVVKKRHGKHRLRCLDLFAGTGVVARFLKKHSDYLAVNDLELYSQITNQCYLANRSTINWLEVGEAFQWLNARVIKTWRPGWLAEMYAPADDNVIREGERVFYTRRNATFLDTARRAIAELPSHLQVFFLAPLLAKASVHANTSGVFKGFYKDRAGVGQFGGHGKDALTRILKPIELVEPLLSNFEVEYDVFQRDANELVAELDDFDLAYIDPPYNQHPYGSNYFMLNILASYERPVEVSNVSGIPVNWNRSQYNKKKEAAPALFDLVRDCNASSILISYNSEGFVSENEFKSTLGVLGKLSVMATPYNTFRGSRNLRERAVHVTEYLYLLEK